MSQYFTIGMAGHIDHGKTSLTKALTGIDTDRLKEEKERNISIEPGYASLIHDDQLEVSIIDVPGHEKFIRQMIAGVAGIDMVILVIAADEEIMPQTKEHLDILSLLGIENGLVVMTKLDQADTELLDIVLEDVRETMIGTFLEDAPIYQVDSLSNKGIVELQKGLRHMLLQLTKRVSKPSFRMPIDQVFTVKGQGVVVRGTTYDGEVRQGDHLKLLPLNKDVRVRQLQRHHMEKMVVTAGQRTAINLGGVSHEEITRGDVLVADDFYSVSDRIDIAFTPLNDRKYKIKQRQPIKLFVGTSEVMGKIVFFDRNEISVSEEEEVLCQIQLDEEIVVTRGDRYILRKPTPEETIGGGFVIEPEAQKHRYGKDTIDQLTLKKEGSAFDRVVSLMKETLVVTKSEVLKQASISEAELTEMVDELYELGNSTLTLRSTFDHVKANLIDLLNSFHQRLPMRIGMNKAEITSALKQQYPVSLIESALKVLQVNNDIKITGQYISIAQITPSLPLEYKIKLERAESELREQGAEVENWHQLLNKQDIPANLQKEFYHYLIEVNKAYKFDDDRLISKQAVDQALTQLETHTELNDFDLQTARDSLQLSRKNLVPLLELFDVLRYTRRVDKQRSWIKKG